MTQKAKRHLKDEFLRLGWTEEELNYHTWRKDNIHGHSAVAFIFILLIYFIKNFYLLWV